MLALFYMPVLPCLASRVPQEQAEGVRSNHPHQHRLGGALSVAPALGQPQAAGKAGRLAEPGAERETLLQHHRLRQGVPPAAAPQPVAGGPGGHG